MQTSQQEEKKPVIRTVGDNQHQILRDIQTLYLPNGAECDPTYSKGVFYKEGTGVIDPPMKFDLFPRNEETKKATADDLPLGNESISSIIFDPPFMAGYTKKKPTGIMGERFHGFRYVPDMWEWYSKCIVEFNRVLKDKGILVFKCQDTVSSGKNWFSHSYVMNEAVKNGFYPKDMFVLTAKSRMIGANHSNQKHARKFHSYFWVFEKRATAPVDYESRWNPADS